MLIHLNSEHPNMKRVLTFVVLCIAFSTAAMAQTAKAGSGADVSIAALRSNWQQAIGNITKAAEELSEADYAYRPVATVRTFGEIVGHVAGSQNLMCAAALGEKQPAEDAIEKAAKTKVEEHKTLSMADIRPQLEKEVKKQMIEDRMNQMKQTAKVSFDEKFFAAPPMPSMSQEGVPEQPAATPAPKPATKATPKPKKK